MSLRLDDFNFHLPHELIAQRPAGRRDESRLMVLDRASGDIEHARFADLGRWLTPGSLIVVNDARVVPVRLWGRKESGARIEVVILKPPPPEAEPGEYEIECLARPARRLKPGVRLYFGLKLSAEVVRVLKSGRTIFRFCFKEAPVPTLESIGHMPLPPYINRTNDDGQESELDRTRYQTVYSRTPGAVAAPTAGLHFTEELLEALKNQGFNIVTLTLLVGYGTFAPVREQDITRHRIEAEGIILPAETADKVNQAKATGQAVTTVGTTGVRSLEFAARQNGLLKPFQGMCDLFIYPGFKFKMVNHLVTNFHLPRSSLLMLVAAFAGLKTILEAYRVAVVERYRFYSYGDAMLIL
ncbi:MAG: tRNA preQ1(34) S-adenosylmethionine ribosyltransferase-isomerase QueA [Deltaproteobacteria bacterium]|nr:tRNA preQ1(34) S-adenosylmethionine ribosyltransferase-isomerase QueA [Deltaproteobacteria bacterium]MBW2086738.1 tRNA preQ1(34) S-adenosylmethionine ribosyltransferase-isomerase QueA [Deltaproteobacteria bacterium]